MILTAWDNWYKTFMVSRRQLHINQRNIPWIDQKTAQAMKQRNFLYKNSRKLTTSRSKYSEQGSVTHKESKGRIFENTKQFWKTFKHLSVQKSMIPTLTLKCSPNNLEKARTLHFLRIFQYKLHHSLSGTCPVC